MWTWNVARASFAVTAVLAALAFSSSSLRLVELAGAAESDYAAALELLTWGFVLGAVGALSNGVNFVLLNTTCIAPDNIM